MIEWFQELMWKMVGRGDRTVAPIESPAERHDRLYNEVCCQDGIVAEDSACCGAHEEE